MKARFIGGPLDGLLAEIPKLDLYTLIPAYFPNKKIPTREQIRYIKENPCYAYEHSRTILNHEYRLEKGETPTYRYQGVQKSNNFLLRSRRNCHN